MRDNDLSIYELIKGFSVDQAYRVTTETPGVDDLARALNEEPSQFTNAFPIIVKIAHASDTEEAFHEAFENRDYPPVRLTNEEMRILQAGVGFGIGGNAASRILSHAGRALRMIGKGVGVVGGLMSGADILRGARDGWREG